MPKSQKELKASFANDLAKSDWVSILGVNLGLMVDGSIITEKGYDSYSALKGNQIKHEYKYYRNLKSFFEQNNLVFDESFFDFLDGQASEFVIFSYRHAGYDLDDGSKSRTESLQVKKMAGGGLIGDGHEYRFYDQPAFAKEMKRIIEDQDHSLRYVRESLERRKWLIEINSTVEQLSELLDK